MRYLLPASFFLFLIVFATIATEPAAPTESTPVPEKDADDEVEESGPKILTKKEKEKLKKEKEKVSVSPKTLNAVLLILGIGKEKGSGCSEEGDCWWCRRRVSNGTCSINACT